MNRLSILALTVLAALSAESCRSRRRETSASVEIPADVPTRPRRESLGELSLNVVELGRPESPLLLVIHGGPGLDHTYLRPWLDPLADAFRVAYVDLRGHGRSDLPASADGYTIRAAAGDLATAIDRWGHGRPAHVLAHDFGCTIAMELAALHGDRVARMVLVGPYRDAGQYRDMPRRTEVVLGSTGYQRLVALSLPDGTLRDPETVGLLFRALRPMWFHGPVGDDVIARLARDVRYRGAADSHFLIDGARWNALLRAPMVRAPTLVLTGDDDRTFLPRESREIADVLPHGRFVTIPAAGHLPFVEQRGRFIEAVNAFLRPAGENPPP